jgi:DNA-binding NarL/FixJ family response regulator
VRALVVSDTRFYRELLAVSIGEAVGTGCECTHAEAASVVARLAPDMVILELGLDAGTTLAMLRASLARPALVGLVVDLDVAVVAVAASLGVRVFVTVDQSVRDLLEAVRAAGAGESICPPRLAALLFGAIAGPVASAATGPALTVREREIAAFLARGMTNKEIAARLVIEPATVKNHVHSVLHKLNLRRRAEVAHVLGGPDRSIYGVALEPLQEVGTIQTA